MNVYFGKMNDEEQVNSLICRGGLDYFGGIQPDDYVFIRLAEEEPKPNTHRLWKLRNIDIDSEGASTAHFDEVFSFDPLMIDDFTRLKLFKVGLVLGNKVVKQVKKVGFFKIELVNETEFVSVTGSQRTFNQYINNKNNFRKIVLVNDAHEPHTDDIQLIKNGNLFEIYNDDKPFLNELKSRFQPNRYIDYVNFLNDNHETPKGTRKKVKEWLESNGSSGYITIAKLWDFFCSSQDFKVSSKGDTETDTSEDNHEEYGSDKIISSETAHKKEDYHNLIIYGIPGCGKSFMLENEYLIDKDVVERTTFHPEYSNADFIGQVRPVKHGKDLEYKVIPGPFTKALFAALKNPEKRIALAIEEINRGNAAAIFGDLFQLLDRDSSGKSEYSITNETISSYLKDNGTVMEKIIIPSNFYIYATMNTSDQNVFKLDTAFKRRWEFERLTNKDTEESVKDFAVFTLDGQNIKWKDFVQAINKIITLNDDISGDRQIGNFFYIAEDKDLKRFANKVLEYLYNDVCKYGGKEEIFNTAKYRSFDEIYDAFISGENVFSESLVKSIQMNTSAIAADTSIADDEEDDSADESTEEAT